VGVALLTVALVCGQMAGGVLVDRFGLTPAGRRALTVARLLAVGLTVAAVGLAALGTHGDPQVVLLGLAVVAGAGIAVQQAAVAHVTQVTGEPVVAGAVNFLMGAVVVTLATAVVAGVPEAADRSAPPGEWIGGLLGATVTVLLARVVAVLGALRVVLAVVAGQSLGGLVIDLVAPVDGETVRAGTVVGVVLTIAAVAVSGRGPSAAPQPDAGGSPG
jgi:transporter family-2 protein